VPLSENTGRCDRHLDQRARDKDIINLNVHAIYHCQLAAAAG